MTISESLDQALNDIKFSHEHSEKITELVAKVRDIKKTLSTTESELAHAVEGMYAQLAVAVRKIQPDLGVSMQKNGCTVGFRSRCIVCKADPHTGKWSFSSDFGNMFTAKYGGCPIDSSLDDIAKKLVDFFSSHFKSLASSK